MATNVKVFQKEVKLQDQCQKLWYYVTGLVKRNYMLNMKALSLWYLSYGQCLSLCTHTDADAMAMTLASQTYLSRLAKNSFQILYLYLWDAHPQPYLYYVAASSSSEVYGSSPRLTWHVTHFTFIMLLHHPQVKYMVVLHAWLDMWHTLPLLCCCIILGWSIW